MKIKVNINQNQNKSKNKNRSYTSLPSISTNNSSAYLTATDDLAFCFKQIGKINQQEMYRTNFQKKPWQKLNKTNIFGQTNYKVLSNLKQNPFSQNIKDIDWSHQNYYNQKQLEKILDGMQIARHVRLKDETKKLSKDPYVDLNTFTKQSKEICLNNMFLDIMRDERKKYNTLIVEKNNAINREKVNLEKDIQTFEDFKESVKEQQRKTEQVINKLVNDNKKLFDKKKKVTQEHRAYLDEIEKMIRLIINMKQYAVFTNNLIGDANNNNLKHVNLFNKLEIKNNKEKELEIAAQEVIKELNFLIDEDNIVEEENLDDPERLMIVFKIMEDNILKLINQKEEYLREINILQNDNNISLRPLKGIVENSNNELEILNKEKISQLKEIDNVPYSEDLKEFTPFAIDLINDLDKTLNQKKLKTDNDVLYDGEGVKFAIRRCFKKLSMLEDDVNNLIVNMEKDENEDNELFEKCVTYEKKYNKYLKYCEEKEQKEFELENKRNRLEKKLRQYMLIGRGRTKDPIPPQLLSRFKKKVVIKKAESDDYEMLYYK